MKTAIICKSIHHSNTLRVAEIMAEELEADIFTPEQIKNEVLQQYDLIGFGSGIYNGRHHRSLLDAIKELDCLGGKDVFVFYTSGFEKFPVLPSFESALVSQLEKKEARVKNGFSCRGLQTWGPFRINGGRNRGHPDETDLTNARLFARTLIQSV